MQNENGNAHLIFCNFLSVELWQNFWNFELRKWRKRTGIGLLLLYTLAGRMYRYRTTMIFPTNLKPEKNYCDCENGNKQISLDAYDDFSSRICIRLRIAFHIERDEMESHWLTRYPQLILMKRTSYCFVIWRITHHTSLIQQFVIKKIVQSIIIRESKRIFFSSSFT